MSSIVYILRFLNVISAHLDLDGGRSQVNEATISPLIHQTNYRRRELVEKAFCEVDDETPIALHFSVCLNGLEELLSTSIDLVEVRLNILTFFCYYL